MQKNNYYKNLRHKFIKNIIIIMPKNIMNKSVEINSTYDHGKRIHFI